MDQRAFIAAVDAAFRSHARTPDGQRLTALHVRIAAKLAFWRQPHPRQRSLARAVGCSTRTVQRALLRLSALGLLSWTRRVIAGSGWRAQVANAYELGSTRRIAFLRIYSSATLSPSGRRATAAAAPPAQDDLLTAQRARFAQRQVAAALARYPRPAPAGSE